MSGSDLAAAPVEDGDHLVRPTPPYVSQFASRDRADEFLASAQLLTDDARWAAAGFASPEDYALWAPRACGAACLKMVLDAAGGSATQRLADVVRAGVAEGAYVLGGESGQVAAGSGWIYRPMAALLIAHGLHAEVFDHRCTADLAGELEANRCVIASVNPRVIRDDPVEGDATRGGHLILVIGYRIANGQLVGFIIHNPSGRTTAQQEQFFSPLDQFERAFAGRGISIALPYPVTPDGDS